MGRLDNLIFEKIWIDSTEDFFEIRVTANNQRITMSSDIYAQTGNLTEFQSGAHHVLIQPFSIVIGNDDDSYIGCVKFSISTNNIGHVSVKIFMKTKSYDFEELGNDTANFTIQTDVASLDRFASELGKIASGGIGEKVQLHY